MPSKQPKKRATSSLAALSLVATGHDRAVATQFTRKEHGVGSLFKIEIKEGSKVFRYDVDVFVCTVNANGKSVQRSLAKGVGDGQKALNRKLCYDLLNIVHEKTNNFGMGLKAAWVYDNKATFYTSEPINLNKIEISSSEVDAFIRTYCCDTRPNVETHFTVHITPNSSERHEITLGKSIENADILPIRTFLEMATSQEAINKKMFSIIGPGKLYLTDAKGIERLNNAVELRPGVKKGVKVITNHGNPCPALVLDCKTSPFFKAQNLLTTIGEVNGGRLPQSEEEWEITLQFIQDLRVEPIYARKQSFEVGRFTDKPINRIKVPTKDDAVLFVDGHFRDKWNLSLKNPNLRGIIPNRPPQEGRSEAVFPIELLEVMPDQRVPIEKMSKDLSDALLKVVDFYSAFVCCEIVFMTLENSVVPSERLNATIQRAEQLDVFNAGNRVLSAFGVRVIRDSNEVMIGVRHPPAIEFRDSIKKTPDSETTRWDNRNARYFATKQVSDWIIYYPANQKDLVNKFKAEYEKAALTKGMRFVFSKDGDKTERPMMIPYSGQPSFKPVFEQCERKKIEFLIFIDSLGCDTHADLKYFEAKHKILTQHITTEIVNSVVNKRQWQTLENIIHKSNCKNFGLNYVPVIEKLAKYALENGKVLVIGLDVSHPPPLKKAERRMMFVDGYKDMDSLEPSVVGISANMAAHPHAFVGDYFYQKSRKESIDVDQLRERIEWVMKTLEANRSEQSRPEFVFILRDGLSEGQFPMAVDDEFAAIEEGFRKIDPDYKPKFLYVVGTKRHFKRFYAKYGTNPAQNPPPGSVVQDPFSSQFIREEWQEGWMISHKPTKEKCTVKAVQYAMLKDSMGIGMSDPLFAFLNTLCYSHQISNSAVSLPEPIYQADALAGRGAKNYYAMKKNDPGEIPYCQAPFQKAVDVKLLTNLLAYKNSGLSSTRFTA